MSTPSTCFSNDVVAQDGTNLRLVNPVKFDKHLFVESLCANLYNSNPERYGFFANPVQIQSYVQDTLEKESKVDKEVKDNKEEMMQLLEAINQSYQNETSGLEEKVHQPELLEQRCLDLFQLWVGKSKLGLAYMLYGNKNLQSEQFVTRLVRHMAAKMDTLHPEELVTMLLCLYFSKKVWKPDQLYDVLDPMALQQKLAVLLNKFFLDNREVCAVCFGLKRIEKFIAVQPDFRQALYNRLIFIGNNLTQNTIKEDDLAVFHIMLLLSQGHLIARDGRDKIEEFLRTYTNGAASNALSIRTAVKVMSFGLAQGIEKEDLSKAVLDRIVQGDSIKELSIGDMAGLAKFVKFSDTLQNRKPAAQLILSELKRIEDRDCTLTDVKDIVVCWGHLEGILDQSDLDRWKQVFACINALPDSVFDASTTHSDISKQIALSLHKELFPKSFSSMDSAAEFDEKFSSDHSTFTRTLSSVDTVLALQNPQFKAECGIELKRCGLMLKFNQNPIPKAALSPQLPLKNMTHRQKIATIVLRHVTDKLGGESYVAMTHLLPHFQEPDIVFGHIAGIRLSVPEKLRRTEPVLKPAPEVGDWVVLMLELGFPTKHDRAKQLEQLGYKVVKVPHPSDSLSTDISIILANELTGVSQGAPVKRAPL